jgi:hypothetical protein
MQRESRRVLVRRLRDAVARALRPARRIGAIDRALGATVDYFIDCRTVRAHLSDLHDHQLPPWQARLARAHLATCATCPEVERSLDDTIALLRELE